MTFMKELEGQMTPYICYLRQEERSEATVSQYEKSIQEFLQWVGERELIKTELICYKEKLQEKYRASTVNVKLAAVNGFLEFCGKGELKVKRLKIQRQAYCSCDRELTRAEYFRLVKAANRRKNKNLFLILQTICGTGIRVSELEYITAEAVRHGEAFICLKGKNRRILLPDKLCRVLKQYMKKNHITHGPVFATRTGKPMDRSNIWKMMKSLCKEAGVKKKKVFPHNLRHLFARCFYSVNKDIAKLADLLGHSSINTTRIYIISTGAEHRQYMEKVGLII